MATKEAVSTRSTTNKPAMMSIASNGGKTTRQRSANGVNDGLEQTSIDIKQDVRRQVVVILNQQLADTFDLFSQTKQAHWNVKGKDFYQLHLLFDTLAEGLTDHIDAIAERVTALGGEAQGTVRMAAKNSRLSEYLPGAADGMTHVQRLVDSYATLAASTRDASEKADQVTDMSTSDLFNEVSLDLDKWLWFLEAHLHGHERA